MPMRMHDDEVDITDQLVRALLREQMPDLADRPLRIVEPWGTDNAIWRLGPDLVVRLPRVEGAAGQIDREAQWLPRLAPSLSLAIPEPLRVGEPGLGYPYRWAVHRWLPGEGAAPERIDDAEAFALSLARFIRELQAVPADAAPVARHRARPLAEYDAQTRQAIEDSRHLIDAEAATAVWEEALAASPHEGVPVWVHADLEGNCIIENGELSGVLDWGAMCVGDPAVDVQVVWSPLFTPASRHLFLDALEVDEATLARSRGAAVHQACSALPYYLDTYPLIVERSWHKLAMLGVRPLPGR